jgi:hypothetical protein
MSPESEPAAGPAMSTGMVPWPSRQAVLIGCLLAALLGFGAIAIGTRWGAGVSPDSAEYVAAARSLLQGRGLSTPAGDGSAVPMTLWPPLFPAALALGGAVGIDLHVAGRWLNAILFAGNILLAAAILLRGARALAWLGWLAAAGVLVFTDVLTVHGWIWSEPLFLFFGLSSLLLLIVCLRSSTRLAWWASAALAAAAFMTRFVGAAFVATGVAAILFLGGRSSWKDRLLEAVGYGIVGGAPMAAWMLRNRLVAGSLSERTISTYRLTMAHARQALDTATAWIWPSGAGTTTADLLMLVLFLIGAGLMLGLLFVPRKAIPQAAGSAVLAGGVLSLFTALYMLVLLFSKAFVDPDFPFDSRILSPLHVAMWLFLLCAAAAVLSWHAAWTSERWPRARRLGTFLVGAAVAIVFALQLAQSVHWVDRAYVRGLGYASKSWQESTLLAYLRTLPADLPIYSNGPDVILDRTERPAYKLPGRPKAGSPKSQQLFETRLEAMRDVLTSNGGLIVTFEGITWRSLVNGEELRPYMPLRILFQSDQGVIYQVEED